MDVIKRNTDYALRAMVHLARNYGGGVISSRVLADAEGISYQLTCKLMQKLHKAGLVTSVMGVKGGFALARDPGEITLAEVVTVIQGPVIINRCLAQDGVCEMQESCTLSGKLAGLQTTVQDYLNGVTLDEFIKGGK